MDSARPPVLLTSSHSKISPRPNLSPAKSIEKSGDLGSGAIRIFAMWEVPHIREWRKVQVRERLAETIGPFVRAQRILLRPSHTRRRSDRRQCLRLSFQHRDATCVA